MRIYRKRRRQGLRSVRILLRVTDIDEFIRLGLLEEDQRESPEAIQTVVVNLLHQIMEEIRDAYPLLVTAAHRAPAVYVIMAARRRPRPRSRPVKS
jgi:hypothetical protein